MKKALITGITGQDGSYLAELLLEKGYEVHGIIRRASTFNTKRIDHLYQDPHGENVRLFLHYGDLTDTSNLNRLLEKIQPDEIYNLGAQSHVGVSFNSPEYTAEATGVSTLRILDAIRETGIKTKFYQASTSELFGGLPDTAPQSEKTPFYPKSPYGVAKLYSYWITVNYRESYDIFACNGILFNHESPRRGETFVTRKITRAAAAIHLGQQDKLYLGNLDAKRDWGHAKDYVEGMWRMLQQDTPQDYVLSMNETHTVREFVELAFAELGYTIEWQGEGVNEKGIDKATGKVLVEVDPRYFRPAEVELLWGDSTKARTELGWKPSYSFMDLVKEMVQSDLENLKSPYGVAKLYSYWITVNYRESYDIFACNGILFNHESPRRGETFVTRKITRAAAAIHLGQQDKLYLGNLDAKRDWGHAKDYVEGMWRMLQQDTPQDYVLSMNETHTVREFVELAFAELGYTIEWQGEGVNEKGIDKATGKVLVEVDPRYFRPAEVELLWGDSTKARTELGWKPSYSFMDLVKEMVQSDLENLKNGGDYRSKFEN